ncbi:MAG: hypothetical protein O3A51_08890 [Verrucomicrobia bacterium]|nr:hypothetical protein [Verrucomicrobiota bacterium]
MSNNKSFAAILMAATLATLPAHAGDSENRLGVGVHYWVAVDDVKIDTVDEDGLAWMFSYQIRPEGLLSAEIGLEILPDNFAGSPDTVYAPQAFALLGSDIYAGVGVGIYYADGDFADDPFFIFRAGLDVEILPQITVDIYGDYRFTEWDNTVTQNIDTDTVTLAAAVRLAI